jgi:hypothetical protein
MPRAPGRKAFPVHPAGLTFGAVKPDDEDTTQTVLTPHKQTSENWQDLAYITSISFFLKNCSNACLPNCRFEGQKRIFFCEKRMDELSGFRQNAAPRWVPSVPRPKNLQKQKLARQLGWFISGTAKRTHDRYGKILRFQRYFPRQAVKETFQSRSTSAQCCPQNFWHPIRYKHTVYWDRISAWMTCISAIGINTVVTNLVNASHKWTLSLKSAGETTKVVPSGVDRSNITVTR